MPVKVFPPQLQNEPMARRINRRAEKVMPWPSVSQIPSCPTSLGSVSRMGKWFSCVGSIATSPRIVFPSGLFMGNLKGLWPMAHSYILLPIVNSEVVCCYFEWRGKKSYFCWEVMIHWMFTGSSLMVFPSRMTWYFIHWSAGQLRSLDFTSCRGHIWCFGVHPWERTSSCPAA